MNWMEWDSYIALSKEESDSFYPSKACWNRLPTCFQRFYCFCLPTFFWCIKPFLEGSHSIFLKSQDLAMMASHLPFKSGWTDNVF